MASRKLRCNRCGRCCYIEGYGECKYLLRIGNSSMCMIYKNRIGTQIAPGYHCGYRKDTKYDFKDCPYNTDKPMFKG